MIILGSNSTSNDINFVILTGVGIVLSLLSLFLACVSSLSSTDQLNRPSVELDNVHTSDSEQTEQEPTSQVQELKVEQTSLGLQNRSEFLNEKFTLLKQRYNTNGSLYDLNELIELREGETRRLPFGSSEWFESIRDLRMMLNDRYYRTYSSYDRSWLIEIDGQLNEYIESKSPL